MSSNKLDLKQETSFYYIFNKPTSAYDTIYYIKKVFFL